MDGRYLYLDTTYVQHLRIAFEAVSAAASLPKKVKCKGVYNIGWFIS